MLFILSKYESVLACGAGNTKLLIGELSYLIIRKRKLTSLRYLGNFLFGKTFLTDKA